MNKTEKIIQISSTPETQWTNEVLSVLTDEGNVYQRYDEQWYLVELPWEQLERLKKEAEEKANSPKKGWFG